MQAVISCLTLVKGSEVRGGGEEIGRGRKEANKAERGTDVTLALPQFADLKKKRGLEVKCGERIGERKNSNTLAGCACESLPFALCNTSTHGIGTLAAMHCRIMCACVHACACNPCISTCTFTERHHVKAYVSIHPKCRTTMHQIILKIIKHLTKQKTDTDTKQKKKKGKFYILKKE